MQVVTETADTTRPEAAPGALKGERDMTTITTTADIRIWLDNAGLLENMTAEETDRVVELLADAEGRPAHRDDRGDYLGARAQARGHGGATGYDEDEAGPTAGLLENMTAEETDRVVELLADAEGRPAYGEDWGDYLGARAQALVHEVATGYDEDEPVLTAVETDGTWAVDDAAGGRWFPGDD